MAGLFRHEAVVIVWKDAHARNQAVEYTEDEIRTQFHRSEPVTTLGLLLHEDAEGYSLYTEETGPDCVRGANFVPAEMVKEVIRLGQLKRPKKRRSKPDASPLS